MAEEEAEDRWFSTPEHVRQLLSKKLAEGRRADIAFALAAEMHYRHGHYKEALAAATVSLAHSALLK